MRGVTHVALKMTLSLYATIQNIVSIIISYMKQLTTFTRTNVD